MPTHPWHTVPDHVEAGATKTTLAPYPIDHQYTAAMERRGQWAARIWCRPKGRWQHGQCVFPHRSTHAPHMRKVHFSSGLHPYRLVTVVQQHAHSIGVCFFFRLPTKTIDYGRAPDRRPCTCLLVPWKILGPAGISNGEPNIEGRLPRMVHDRAESNPRADGRHGQPSLRLVPSVHLQRHPDRLQIGAVVPLPGSRLQALWQRRLCAGVLRALLYYARARSYCVTTRPILQGPVSFVHCGVRVVEGVPMERCYWKDGDGRPHAVVYFSSGDGVSMVRVPFSVVRATRQREVWA